MKRKIFFGSAYIYLFITLVIILTIIGFVSIRLLREENQQNYLKNEIRNISTEIENRFFLKLKGVSTVLANDEQIKEILKGNTLPDNKDILLILETVKNTFSASIVYVMNQEGTVVASTVYDKDKSLTGKNYAFRPYFKGAMQGENVIYPALGVTTEKRGLYFSSPVYIDNIRKSKGVIVIKIGLREFDSLLKALTVPAAVVSSEGIIFATNRPSWLYRSIYPLSSEKLAFLKQSRQFADIEIKPLDWIFYKDTVSIDNEWHYIVKHPFLSSNWQIILCERVSENYPLTKSQKVNLVIAFLIVIILISIIFMLIANIRQRKIAEHQIASSEKHLRTIMDTTIDGFWQIDKNAITVDINPSMLKILGLKRKDVIGKSIFGFLDDKNAEIFRSQLNAYRGRKESSYELTFKRADGTYVNCLINATPLFDNKGNQVGSFALVNDITVRKRAEEALRESEMRYRLTINAMEELVHVIDRNFRFCLYNTAFHKFVPELNITDDLYGKSVFEVFPFLPDKVSEEYKEVLETGKSIITQEETEVSGRTVWTDTQKIPILDDTGKVYRILTIVRDITKQRQAENALREREKRFRDITDNSLAWIWEVDAEGKYTYSSPIVEKILGYTPEEIVGKKYFYDLFHPKDREEMKNNSFKIFEKKQAFREFENQNIHKNGKLVWILTSAVPILDKEGKLLGYRGGDTDITERKKAEEELIELKNNLEIEVEKKTKALVDAQNKLIQSERLAAMGQLGSIVAHEFRNQLGVMRNAIYFLKMKMKDKDEKILKHLKILDDEIVQTDLIIENILMFVRTRAPKLKAVNIKNFIFAILDKMRVKQPKEINIKTDIEDNLPDISVDEVQMTQVFVNIIANAFESIKVKGTLLIKAKRRERYVSFIFEDDGPGIKREIIDRVFEPLFTTKARGTGLGLAAVKILVEKHGGKVSVESEEGKGARFTLQLPIIIKN